MGALAPPRAHTYREPAKSAQLYKPDLDATTRSGCHLTRVGPALTRQACPHSMSEARARPLQMSFLPVRCVPQCSGARPAISEGTRCVL